MSYSCRRNVLSHGIIRCAMICLMRTLYGVHILECRVSLTDVIRPCWISLKQRFVANITLDYSTHGGLFTSEQLLDICNAVVVLTAQFRM